MKRMQLIKISLTIILFVLSGILTTLASEAKLERVAIYNAQDECEMTEIVSIQETTQRIALSCSAQDVVDIISIQDPSKPTSLNHFKVSNDEEISAVAFHPTENVIAVAVINFDPFAAGKIQIHDANTGEILKIFKSAVHPDGLAFSPNGKFLVIANEGEAYRYNGKEYESPAGSITLINIDNASQATTIQTPLDDYSNVKGMLHKNHARKLERIVIGGNSSEETEVPINDNRPANTEPEFFAFAPDSSKAYISLQENNGILIVDTATAKIEKVFGLGMTEHLADIDDNNKVKFNKKITALREPDGISISPNGKYLLTADVGDTDPKASKTLDKKSKGGG